ncbi:MAG: hypothetical protein ACD_65C00248G0003 [uncultured bacterium]|nr:MAG: hypothetical protein ACD_65C00248G0003 [uncultured bacterium]KKT02332.1 MAG: hypothetical protein UV80_C0004G0021 [Candidatus Peregrinibacteria bacterium GW2011_GWF2_43_17]KKT20328.1 MAG: hypothetical protein UW03_C0006G0063 [Candidatus Peregrinibacteria bacterium GW2011_GWA2_43_8]HAU39417.1 hypothetical protein [Candidatus Peregrinibacteria bacterium]
MSDDFTGLNKGLFARFLMFFLVASFLFGIFLWVTFLKDFEAETVLDDAVYLMEDGVQNEFSVGEYDFESKSEVVFDGIDVVRFSEGSAINVGDVTDEDGFYTVSMTLEEGSAWISNMGGVLDLMIKVDGYMFQNVDGYYYVEVNENGYFAYAYKHPVSVYFLDESGNSLNDYILPQGYYVELERGVPSSVVSDLRYAKLVKEYPFYKLTENQAREGLADYAKIDDLRYSDILGDFEAMVLYEYDDYVGESGGEIVDKLREILTFSESKKDEWSKSESINKLNAALYLSAKGSAEDALSELQDISSVIDEKYLPYLNYVSVVLNNSLYGDDLYVVKNYLREVLWGDSYDGQMVVLRDRLNEMYDLCDDGEMAFAKEAFSDYERGWWDFLGMSADELSVYRDDINEERELLSVLLLKEEGFYDTDYFDLLESFEQAIFKVAISGTDLDEERLVFIADKVDVVNSVTDLLALSQMSVAEATDLLGFLLDDAEVLASEVESTASILSYYEEEISEGWLVLKFINSVEYESTSGTFDEKYEAFVAKEQDVEDLRNYLQNLHLGDESSSGLTLTEAKEIVYSDLETAGISYTAIISMGDNAYRLFELNGAEAGGVSFEAKYDRESKLVYDLAVGESRFTTGVSLDDLSEVVSGVEEGEITDEVISDAEEAEVEEGFSSTEEAAIVLLIEYLSEFGIEAAEKNVVFVEVDENIFEVRGAIAGETVLDFVVDLDDGSLSEVYVDGEVSGIEDIQSLITGD